MIMSCRWCRYIGEKDPGDYPVEEHIAVKTKVRFAKHFNFFPAVEIL